MTPSPLRKLHACAREMRSGEFICASETLEVHVFLQRGRVAWATDSSHPFEFARQLKSHRNIDDATFRELVETCRRDRLRLGETLIAWEIASWGEVHSALEHQLRLAIQTLADCEPGSTVFLERKNFAAYDEKLTFDVRALLPSEADEDGPVRTMSGEIAMSPSTARQLFEVIKGARWVHVVEGGALVEMAGRTEASRAPSELSPLTLADGADFVAVRGADGCLLGAHLSGTSRQFWTLLAIDSTFGATVAALSATGLLARRRRKEGTTSAQPWDVGTSSQLDPLQSFGREVLGAIVLGPDGAVLAGRGRDGLDLYVAQDVVRRRRIVFGELGQAPWTHGTLGSMGFDQRTMVTGEADMWCFGSENVQCAGKSCTLWVFARREGGQGLGWACLNSLARSFSKDAAA